MNDFVIRGISGALDDIKCRYEISEVLKEVTLDIEVWDKENTLIATTNELLLVNAVGKRCVDYSFSLILLFCISKMKAKSKKQTHELHRLTAENENLKDQLSLVQKKSRALRDRFIMDIGMVLRESKRLYQQQTAYKDLEMKLKESNALVFELNSRIKVFEDTIVAQDKKIADLTSSPKDGSKVLLGSTALVDLDDDKLLSVFSFLDTMDVISTAQSCKSLYTRIDSLFGIESSVAAAMVSAGSSAGGTYISSNAPVEVRLAADETVKEGFPPADKMMQQLDELSRKLTGSELKLILSLTERVKSLSSELVDARVEKEDIAANLQVK
jgi:hypothetical protein